MKRHVELLEGRVPATEKVKVLLEGNGRVGKIMRGKKLLETVTFDDGDDLSIEIPKLVEEFENQGGDDFLVEGDEGVEVVPDDLGNYQLTESEGGDDFLVEGDEGVETLDDDFGDIPLFEGDEDLEGADLATEEDMDPIETALQEGSTKFGARRK